MMKNHRQGGRPAKARGIENQEETVGRYSIGAAVSPGFEHLSVRPQCTGREVKSDNQL